MKLRMRRGLLLAVCLLATLLLAGCGSASDTPEGVPVTFVLCGGGYKNCELPVVQYYQFEGGGAHRIGAPGTFAGGEVVRIGYVLEGWYRGSVASDGSVNYGEKWDFERDTVGAEGMTLYARWKKDILYTYTVCYRDGDETVALGSYDVNAGEEFDDYIHYANKRDGYTPLGYENENGDPWDENTKHPGGEENTDVKVYVSYIEGNFQVVRTANDLKKAAGKNIYLAADIDFKGAEFGGFRDYGGIFCGNGHTVSNFVLTYGADKNSIVPDADLGKDGNLLVISLFGKISDKARIENVSFRDVSVNISTRYSNTTEIILCPLAVRVPGDGAEAQMKNVTLTGKYAVVQLPTKFDRAEHLTISQNPCYLPVGTGAVVNCTVEISEQTDPE